MYIVTVMNQKGEIFDKKFYSGFYFDNFMNKLRYSKRLKVVAWERVN